LGTNNLFDANPIIDVANPSGAWTTTDTDLEALMNNFMLYKGHFLNEVQKHYGAYIYIDENYALNFINRGQQDFLSVADITDYILDKELIQKYYRITKYDGILVSQKTYEGGGTYEISWRYIKYVNGAIEIQRVTSENGINYLQKDQNILDLRQELGAQIDNNGNVIGTRKDKGYHVFPQRTLEDTFYDYEDLFIPPQMMNCKVETLDINLLDKVRYGETYPKDLYLITRLEDNSINETMDLELRKVHNGITGKPAYSYTETNVG